MNVFWRLGYENVSLDVLMAEMAVARQSLYDTFGDKRALSLKALAHYRDESHSVCS
jgi:TetR/AcrR family transcriptional repressor of nem operon